MSVILLNYNLPIKISRRNLFEDSFSPKFQANICSNSLLDVKEENNISQVLDFFSMGILFLILHVLLGF